jgi:PAS domain S-box-containing protein
MISPVIAFTATAAPAVVALICLSTYRKLGGGRHLLFWAVAHGMLVLPFAVIGLTRWTLASWYLTLPATAGLLTATVMLASGIRVLIGRPDRLAGALVVSLAATVAATAIQQIGTLFYFATANAATAIGLVYAGALLLRHRRSMFYSATGVLLLARGGISAFYAIELQNQNGGLDTAFSLSIFCVLLTGLGLIMIEFDNARQREQRAREEEHRTRLFIETLVDAMPATMTYKDRDLRYRMVNRRMREITDTSIGNLIGRTWSEVVGSDTAASVEAEDRRVIRSGEPATMEQGWAMADGRQLIIWAMKVPLRDADGMVQGVITCGIDITRLKETEVQLIEQREAAETANRTKTAFLANMSHELRTPLNAIIGFSEMLAAGYIGGLSERQQEYADHIRQSGQHLLQLVSDILDLSRLETGRLEVDPEICSFAEIASTAMTMVAPQARRGDIVLKGPAEDMPVRADRRALTQILVNLLGNAVKFSQPGDSVSLLVRNDPQFVQITVQDSGIGMSDEELRAAMAAFQRIDAYRSRSNSGAGLGLSICRSLIDRHGGHMEIRSRPGAGTVVDVFLPH